MENFEETLIAVLKKLSEAMYVNAYDDTALVKQLTEMNDSLHIIKSCLTDIAERK